MSSAAALQQALDTLGDQLGALTQVGFDESYLSDWPDEEAVTGALLGSLVTAAGLFNERMAAQTGPALLLRATLTKKRDEARHGVDALIRFRCDEADWKLETAVLLQAKRQEPGKPMATGDHDRLRGQLIKMLAHTPESFVMTYSREKGICIVPAVAAQGLRSRDLFDLAYIPWPRFLSGVLRGRFGEIMSTRLPREGQGWMPMFELELAAVLTREEPQEMVATA